MGLIETVQTQSQIWCAFQCIANEKCLSYNYQHDSSSELHDCELLDRTKNEALLTARSGYSHYETAQVCNSINTTNKSQIKISVMKKN